MKPVQDCVFLTQFLNSFFFLSVKITFLLSNSNSYTTQIYLQFIYMYVFNKILFVCWSHKRQTVLD